MKRLACFLVAVAVLLGACGPAAEQTAASAADGVSIREAPEKPDPQGAVDAIYAALPDSRTTELTQQDLEQKLQIDMQDVVEYYGRLSDPVGGLADVIVLLAQNGRREVLLEKLNAYKMLRMREFENYDILNAYAIAQNSIIYDQGDYLVLLMLEDNEAAQETIDQYMPQ